MIGLLERPLPGRIPQDFEESVEISDEIFSSTKPFPNELKLSQSAWTEI